MPPRRAIKASAEPIHTSQRASKPSARKRAQSTIASSVQQLKKHKNSQANLKRKRLLVVEISDGEEKEEEEMNEAANLG